MTLSAAAPSGGFVVSLTSSTEGIALPATVMVPAGATTAAFTAIVSSVGTAQTATLTASSGSVSQTFSLQLNAAVPTLTVSATSLAFGSVQVNYTAAAQSVTLSSTGTTPVTIGSAALTGAGFAVSGVTYPVTLNPGQTITLNVQFDPATVGAATGQLTITSDSSSRATAVIGLSGTGTSVPANLTALSCTSSSLMGGSSDSCTVTLSAAIRSQWHDGEADQLHGAMWEMINRDWVLTDAGLESPRYGIFYSEQDFPERKGFATFRGGEEPEVREPPARPDGVDEELWEFILRRARGRFPRRHGPFITNPQWRPLSEGPRDD